MSTELKKLESIVRKGQQAFFDAARALLEIDRRELWKPEFASIVEYAAARFDFSPCDVSRYRNAGVVLENLAEFEKLPTNEAQCRELARLRHKDPQSKVWQAVLDSDQKITGKLIADTAAQVLDGVEPEVPTDEPVEVRTAIHEIVTAVKFLQAAKDRLADLDNDGRHGLLEQVKLVEQQVAELRALLAS